MDLDKMTQRVSVGFAWVATILFALGIVEWILAVLKLMQPRSYEPGRLVETAVWFLVPVIAVQLRQIRGELRNGKSS